MKFTINNAKVEDLADIMTVENACFTAEEASSKAAMLERIQKTSDTFFVARDENGRVIGICTGPTYNKRYIDDFLFENTLPSQDSNHVQTILSLAVLPEFQGHHIAQELLKAMVAKDREMKNIEIISLTCLKSLVPYYEALGFVNEGISASQHAGETWYNMTYDL